MEPTETFRTSIGISLGSFQRLPVSRLNGGFILVFLTFIIRVVITDRIRIPMFAVGALFYCLRWIKFVYVFHFNASLLAA